MTQDEIIRMAQEAGFDIGGDGLHAYHPDTRDELPLDTYLEHFAALVAAHEREACAKVCDEHAAKAEANGYTCKGETFIDGFGDGSGECAAAIRVRGEK